MNPAGDLDQVGDDVLAAPDDAERAIERLRREVTGEPPEAPEDQVTQDTATSSAGPSEVPPTPEGSPHTFTDRASFLAVRDAFVTSMVERLQADRGRAAGEVALHDRVLADVYATAIETRLALVELDGAISASRNFFEHGPGRFLGRVPRRRREQEGNDGQG